VLRTFLSNVLLLEDRMDMLIDELGDIGPRDALLVLSSEPYAVNAVKAVEHAVKAGAAVIALTDNPVAPVARGAAHVFSLPNTTTAFYQSHVSKMALIEAFVVYLFARGGARAVKQVKTEFERRGGASCWRTRSTQFSTSSSSSRRRCVPSTSPWRMQQWGWGRGACAPCGT
jgi:DNA-binding MurR/RpiR family transcriptional regulator